VKETKVCTCLCHVDGQSVTHMFDCCELCYSKYIDKDGNIDINRWAKSFISIHKHIPSFRKSGNDVLVHL